MIRTLIFIACIFSSMPCHAEPATGHITANVVSQDVAIIKDQDILTFTSADVLPDGRAAYERWKAIPDYEADHMARFEPAAGDDDAK